MIEIQNLTKRFSSANGDITALQDINLTVNDGEIFGIIGLSGAGKSTLVRCINLLEKPTEGSVIVDGQDLTKMKTKDLLQMRRSIGMIFQSFNLLEQRNVIGNILLFLPFGFYVGYYLKKAKLSLITIISFVTSLTIELIQTKIGRTFDIDDIILNIIGGILGFLIYKVYDNLFINLSEKVKKIIMVLFLLLLGCGIIIIIV